MSTDQIKQQFTPGVAFKYSIPGHEQALRVKTNDGHTLIADVVGGPRDGTQMTWCLAGLEQIPEITQ